MPMPCSASIGKGMILKQQDSEHDVPDYAMVEQLVLAAANAMERATIPNITTAAEVLSAVFTLTSRTLSAMRKLQDPKDATFNANAVRKVLEELLVDFGHVPN